MNWINMPLKPVRLAALILMLGSGLVSAAEPVASQQAEAVVETTSFNQVSPAQKTQVIRLAWDRVGAMA